jgi:hypothetical protein
MNKVGLVACVLMSLLMSCAVKPITEAEREPASPGWKKQSSGVTGFNDFSYELKAGVGMGFTAQTPLGNPAITYYRHTFWHGDQDSTGFWLSSSFDLLVGCFASVFTEHDGSLKSFELRSDIPDFVAKSLGYPKEPMKLIINTSIVINSPDDKHAVSDIHLIARDGKVLDVIKNDVYAYSALIEDAEAFRNAKQCEKESKKSKK